MGFLAGAAIVATILVVRWWRSGQKWGDFLGLGTIYIYARLWHRLQTNGLAPLPAHGPAILVANHTCSADPAFLSAVCSRPISFIIAREYYNIGWFRGLFDYMGCVPVSRNGRDAAGVRAALRRLAEGRCLCIFPEGGLSNPDRKRIRPSKAGVALLALRSRAPVFPALITGGPQTSNVLHAWLCPSHARVRLGPVVDLSAYYGRPVNRKLLEELTHLLMQRIANLDRSQAHPMGKS